MYLPHRQFTRMLMMGGPMSAMNVVLRTHPEVGEYNQTI